MKATQIYLLGLALFNKNAQGFAPPSSSAAAALKRSVPSASSSLLFGYDSNNKNSFSVPDIDISSITDSLSGFDVEQVAANVKGDNDPFGSRGEYYTFAQFALIICILIGGLPYGAAIFQFIGGPGLLLGGIAVALASLGDLGSD
ncbi:MAG: hypothetical protein SGILL_001504, partial [Bacillariaceae sp.]